MTEQYSADVLVVGGGMAGLTAAYRAASRGAHVVLVEKAPQVGGSAALSGGFLWTARSYEQLRAECPLGDPGLQRVLIDGFRPAVEWVRASGVEVSGPVDVLYGQGYRVDLLEYQSRAVRAVGRGGVVSVGARVDWLLVEDGRVVGARVHDADGPTDVRAPWTLLATGGFQGNRGYLQQYLGDKAAHLLHRSNPYSTGDGLRLGLAAGAATAGVMDSYYGHLIAAPIPQFTEREYGRFARLYSDLGVLVNVAGLRFAQEWLGDHLNTQRVAEQPEGRAVLVIDERIRRGAAASPAVKGLEAVDTVEDSRAAGAHVARAPDLEGLAKLVGEWGYRVPDLPGLVEEHRREAAAAGRPGLGEGPYHALELRPGITFTQGGLRIDARARVLDAAGEPVGGLLAAGADTGDVYNGGYAGGLAMAAVFGLVAENTVSAGA